jgi:hypothetical protein
LGGISDSLHGHSREGIWEHCADKEAAELNRLEDIDALLSNSCDESTEEGKTDKASRSNGESFSDGGGGVSGGIEGVSAVSDVTWESTHFGDTSGVI